MIRDIFLLTTCVLSVASAAADEWTVGRDVPAASRVSVDAIDHSVWNTLVSRYVDSDGLVDYASWKARDLNALNGYLNELSRADLDKSASRDAKLAYWINAYNAVTVRGILREYPTSSIRNHTAKLWGYNIWKQLFLKVDGQQFSLDAIEHQVLRPMKDPRIHFAIVCASIGCPRLLNEAYTAESVDEQLDLNARDFFSRSQNFRVSGSTVYLSSILDWFGEDFGASQSAQLRRISEWVPAKNKSAVTSAKARVSFLDYDWNLNSQK